MAYIVDIDNPNNIKALFLKGEDVPVSPINYELTELEEQLLNDAITSLNEVNPNHRYMTFGFITDLHESYNDIPYGSRVETSKPSLKLLGAIGQAYGLDGVFFGGDYSTGNELTYEQYDAALEELLTTVAGTISVPHFATEGNHDRRYKSSLPCRGNAVWRDFLERFNTPGRAVFPDENNTANGYEANTYYVDFPKYKVRVVMQSQYEKSEMNNYSLPIGQGGFANNINSCLTFDPPSLASKWTVLIVSHYSDFTNTYNNSREPFIKKFINGTLNDGYGGKGAVGELYGHVHNVTNYDVNDDGELIRISQWNAFTPKDFKIGTGTGFDGPEEYQYQFSLYVIDTDRCMLHVIQVGRPYNRTGNPYYDSASRIFSYPFRHKEASGNTLKFYHISDVHNRIYSVTDRNGSIEACKDLMDEPDDDAAFTIFTGDFANDTNWNADKTEAFKNLFKSFNTEHDLLAILGNHDAWQGFDLPGNPQGTGSGVAPTKKAAAFFKYVMGDKVAFGDVDSNDTLLSSYWHKDYPLPNGSKLRIIAIDQYQYRRQSEQGYGQYDAVYLQSQVDWFINHIVDLDAEDYLLVALHTPPVNKQDSPDTTAIGSRRKNAFCSAELKGWGSSKTNSELWPMLIKAYKDKGELTNVDVYNTSISKVTVNADFRNATPCTFLGYLCGHVHADIHLPHPNPLYSDQLIMCIDCSTANTDHIGASSDIPEANRTDDNGAVVDILINEVTIDFEAQTITISRIGNNKAALKKWGGNSWDNVDPHFMENINYKYPAIERKWIKFNFNGERVDSDPLSGI